jgi:NADPH:quinone reductase-like Zn-dependent oxidoreductase
MRRRRLRRVAPDDPASVPNWVAGYRPLPEYAHAREAKLVSMPRILTARQAAALSTWGLTALQALAIYLAAALRLCTGTSLERRDRPD